ncbi:MAG: transketolase [Actinomycetes bacterium]
MSVGERTDSPFEWTDLDRRAVDTVRVLAMDAVEKAGSGHPGTAMSLAPAAYLLFQRFLRHDPAHPDWLARDRFVLSCGHSSLTLYIQLYLSGYPLALTDLQSFRTWGSLTPGHPEHGHTVGVETTTGPLGQGIATAVGMAMAARRERGLFDPGPAVDESVLDHTIWVIVSDGDMEEGISGEASSLAGHQRLGNLVVLYDDNHISIEGDTDVAFSEDVLARYAAYGWHTQRVAPLPDGDVDVAALHTAMLAAREETGRPSIIAMRTVIAWPAPHAQNTGEAHGAPLGAPEVAATKRLLGFDPERSFEVDADVLAHARQVVERGAALHAQWSARFAQWRQAHPGQAAELDRISARTLPEGWTKALPVFPAGSAMATRKASGEVLAALGPVLPELWGGSADLAGSNNTTIDKDSSFLPVGNRAPGADPYGRTLHWGIREHAMGATMNGIALHGGTRVYGGTFLVFSDYMRGSVRLSALMRLPVTFVWTHDSIGLGEDGPTHQPVEHLAALRAIPGLAVVRPGDANETVVAWRTVLERADGPVGLVLTRQNLPTVDRDEHASAQGVARGAYVLAEAGAGTPEVILVATGSEVAIALDARTTLEAQGVPTRVVSMPCREWFDEQDADYREQVLPRAVRARVSVEAGVAQGWHEIVGDAGRCISLEHFGASAAYQTLYRELGITAEAVVAAAQDSWAATRR